MKNNCLFKVSIVMFLLIITSCTNSSKFDSSTYNELKGLEIPLSESSCPVDIQIIDNLIIIQESCDTCFFHIYNKESLKFIGKFGKKGKGPFEYQRPKMIIQSVKKNDSCILYVYDNVVNRIDEINILKAISKELYYPKTVKINHSDLQTVSSFYSAVVTADSFVVGTTQNHLNNGRFFCYEIANSKFSYQPYYPQTRVAPHKLMLSHLYACMMALRTDGEKIAVACRYLKRIDILDKKGQHIAESIFETQDEEPDFSSNKRIPPLSSHIYFGSISVTNRFIFALDINKNTTAIDLDESNMKQSGDSIMLYRTNWDGKFIDKMKLSPRVLKIAVDEQSNTIYGINPAYESKFLYLYKNNQ